MAVKNTTIF